METVTLDYVDGISFPKKNAPILNYQELYNIRWGLLWLYGQVHRNEFNVRDNGKGPMACWGHPFFDGALMSCFFQWYAVSLVNHCRHIGTMDFLRKEGYKDTALLDTKNAERAARYTKEYVRKVCPDVLLWRDKVSAHFALTDVRKGDTIGSMRTGVSLNVGFSQDRMRTAAISWDHAKQLPSWSITEETERLAARYWPDYTIKSPFEF